MTRPPEGLSPRVRGNPPNDRELGPNPGSIPACAGEPPDAGKSYILPKVYPRVCGGTEGVAAGRFVHIGLSPRVRGNRALENDEGRPPGSIPACAGEPDGGAPTVLAWRVYPRVCGGTNVLTRGSFRFEGLSPRVRGNRALENDERGPAGSIPACAGEPGEP